MPRFNKFNCWPKDLLNGVHALSSHTLQVMLTNVEPLVTNQVDGDITEISAGFGYSAGGMTVGSVVVSETSGVGRLAGADMSLAASGGDIGPFQWAVIYNASAGGAGTRPLIGFWDYGSPLTISDGDTGAFNFVTTGGVILEVS